MPKDRVDTTRPEYSWIPFFEELARRLHEDGWRDRQAEIVAELKDYHHRGYEFNVHVHELASTIDPFSLYALLCTNLRWEGRSRLFDAYKGIFGIESEIPSELPIVPRLFQKIFFFTGNDSDGSQSQVHWELFEALTSDSDDIIKLMDASLNISEVKISKLTMAMFWICPYAFAHVETLTSSLARINGTEPAYPRTGLEYLELLRKLIEVDPRPIPEINVSELVARRFLENPNSKRVWRILAWKDHRGVSEFLESQSAKIHYSIHEIDFAEISSGDELKELLRKERPDFSDRVLTQLAKFGWEAKRGDILVMPTGESDRVHVGYFTTDGAFLRHYDGNPQPINHRSVAWRHELAVPGIPTRSTFVEIDKAADDVRRLLLQAEGVEVDDVDIQNPLEVRTKQIPVQWPSAEVFLEDDAQLRMLSLLRREKNLILQGPPGTGKTFIARRLAYALMEAKDESRVASVQFHQSYSYEDFVGGLRPDVNEDDQLVFKATDGAFLRLCEQARQDDSDRRHVMLIDEINRGNLSRVFGELMMLIEPDKRKVQHAVQLQHRLQMPDHDDDFFVPENVYIIGTMNLADRSLTGMNVAMRRRFGFVTLEPRFESPRFKDWIANMGMPDWICGRVTTLNQSISDDPSLGRQYAVGHSFFCPGEDDPLNGDWNAWYEAVVEHEIKPLLEEYWFDQPEKAEEHVSRLVTARAQPNDRESADLEVPD